MNAQFGVGTNYILGIYRSRTTRLILILGKRRDVYDLFLYLEEADIVIAAYESHNARKVAKFAAEYQQSMGS